MSTETIEAPAKNVKVTASGKPLNAFADHFNKAIAEQEKAEKKEEPVKEPLAAAATPTEKKEPVAEPTEGKKDPLLESFHGQGKPKEEGVSTEKKDPAEIPPVSKDVETNLGKLRQLKEVVEKERDQYKAELEKARLSVPEDYAALKEEHAFMQSELKKYNLAATPEFKKKYDEKLNFAKKNLERIVGNTDIPASEFLAIVESPDSKQRIAKIAEMTEGMDQFSQTKIHAQIAEYDRVREERDAELAQPDASLQQLTERQKAEQAKRQQEQTQTIFDVIKEAETELPWLVESEGQTPEWKETIKTIKAQAADIWSNPKPLKNQAQVILAGTMAPLLMHLVEAGRVENERLNSELAKLRGATPSNGAQKSSKEAPATNESKKDGFLTAFKKQMAS